MINAAFSMFLQLCLAALAFAAPLADETVTTTGTPMQYGTGGGILGFIILILDIIVFSTLPRCVSRVLPVAMSPY